MGLTFASLCSGVGGFDIGFEAVGLVRVFQCERDKDARSVLMATSPDTETTEDVNSDETSESLCRLRPDLVCFGFPCQDLSVAGKRAGLAGERSGLFFRCASLAAQCDARWLVIENVPGLLSSNGGRDMGIVLGTLGELGYRWAYRVLDAQYFGVAQRRRRVFIVGHLGDGADPAEILFDAASLSRNPPTRGEAGARVAVTLTAGTSNGSGVSKPGRRREDDFNLVAATLNSGGNDGGFRTEPGEHLVYAIQERACAESLTSGPGGKGYQDTVGYTLEARHRPQAVAFAQNQRDEIRDLGECAGSLQAEPGMKQQTFLAHEWAVRRLLPVECERLMGWPDGWTLHGHDGRLMSDSARYRMCGNGVVGTVAEWIGRRLRASMQVG